MRKYFDLGGFKWQWCLHCRYPTTVFECCDNSHCNASGCEVCLVKGGPHNQASKVLNNRENFDLLKEKTRPTREEVQKEYESLSDNEKLLWDIFILSKKQIEEYQ